jgi:hypothetical protein
MLMRLSMMSWAKGKAIAVQSRNGYVAVDLYGKNVNGAYGCIRNVETGKPAECAWSMHAEAFWMMIDHTRVSKRKRKV